VFGNVMFKINIFGTQTRRPRILTTRPTTGRRTTIGAAPATSGTTSTLATDKRLVGCARRATQDHAGALLCGPLATAALRGVQFVRTRGGLLRCGGGAW
jgi:hypothetical protein